MNRKIGFISSAVAGGAVAIFLICLIVALFTKNAVTENLLGGNRRSLLLLRKKGTFRGGENRRCRRHNLLYDYKHCVLYPTYYRAV